MNRIEEDKEVKAKIGVLRTSQRKIQDAYFGIKELIMAHHPDCDYDTCILFKSLNESYNKIEKILDDEISWFDCACGYQHHQHPINKDVTTCIKKEKWYK